MDLQQPTGGTCQAGVDAKRIVDEGGAVEADVQAGRRGALIADVRDVGGAFVEQRGNQSTVDGMRPALVDRRVGRPFGEHVVIVRVLEDAKRESQAAGRFEATRSPRAD